MTTTMLFPEDETAQLRSERDLYLKLLSLAGEEDIAAFLEEALGLVIDASGAAQGFLELSQQGSDASFCLARGFSDAAIDEIRRQTSQGIIAEAIRSGKTVHTHSAATDPRFRDAESVTRNQISEVICAQVKGRRCQGVVYLQDGQEEARFHKQARMNVELFAQHAATLADKLFAAGSAAPDPTAVYRQQLDLRGLIGRSAALASVFEEVRLVAPLHVHVLLSGESGTGKSALARVLVANGPRASKPFVDLNCAALPELLFESELFGALKGAHSTADRDVAGKLVAAEGGTIFLDEVAELSLNSQAKLLHFIQTRNYHPLGAAESRSADVRVIAASNVPLEKLVQEGRFRADLMYRLQVLPIHMPSLAERSEDIPELVRYFCAETCRRHGMAHLEISEDALAAAQSAPWPGNVRQLAHAVEAAVIRANGSGATNVRAAHLIAQDGEQSARTYAEATRLYQRGLLQRTLEECDWNVSKAAKRLELARSHIYNLMEAFEIQRRG